MCAIQLHLLSCIVYIIIIYTSPSGNFSHFLKNIEYILNSIYSNSIVLIISGDLNINYLNDNYTKQLLDSLLASHYLYSTVQFPTRILINSSAAINNIFINKFEKDNFTVNPLVNGLSDTPRTLQGNYISTQAERLLTQLTDKFGALFNIRQQVFIVDAHLSNSPGLRAIQLQFIPWLMDYLIWCPDYYNI